MADLGGRIESSLARLCAELSAAERALLDAALAAQPKATRTYGFEDIGAEAQARLTAIASLAPARASHVSRALILSLLQKNGALLGRSLNPRVGQRTKDTLAWLVPWLEIEQPEPYAFPADLFLKDYRFATGMTVPCGAQVVDLAERPGFKSILAAGLRRPRHALSMATGDWFRPHTESRYLDEFNEAGWNRCYAEIVDLLALRPQVVGMVATSWFYDPALTEISPRLAYLREVPSSNGAIGVAHGTTAFDIHSATATSPTRRGLYEEGKYRPTCWSILWLRQDMIAWRRRNPDA